MPSFAKFLLKVAVFNAYQSNSSIFSGVKITVSHQPKANQFSKIAAHFLVWSDIFQMKEGWVYRVVHTCVVGVADINNLFCC